MRRIAVITVVAAGLCAAPAFARDCPAAVPFGPDDRLADLAARCGVAAGAILRANEAADEAALRQAGAVAIPQAPGSDPAGPGLLDRAREATENTAERAEGIAAEAGDAASDYLSGSELGRDLRDLGQSAGLLAKEEASDPAQLSVVALDAGRLRVAATGLPGGQAVTIVLVQGESAVPLQEVTTEPDGTLLVEIARPEAQPGAGMRLAIEAGGRRLATAFPRQP